MIILHFSNVNHYCNVPYKEVRKTWKQVFSASENKGTIEGVEKKIWKKKTPKKKSSSKQSIILSYAMRVKNKRQLIMLS